MTLDLFHLSTENTVHLEQAFAQLCAEDPKPDVDLLTSFLHEVASNGQVSLNMRPYVTVDLLLRERYDNVYEAVDEHAALSGKPKDEMLANRLGKYYKRRTRFDSFFVNGDRFKYGALNIGGAGAPRYGNFCVVLKRTFPDAGDRVAYVKNDSLNAYTDDDGNLDRGSFQKDLAAHTHRQHLAALKHARELVARKHEWPKMLCSESDYVETIFIANLTHSKIDEVRITSSDYQALFNLCFDSHGRRLSDAEQALANDFIQILRETRAKEIRLSKVTDA